MRAEQCTAGHSCAAGQTWSSALNWSAVFFCASWKLRMTTMGTPLVCSRILICALTSVSPATCRPRGLNVKCGVQCK